jgi:hypothetical protein
MGLFLIGYRKIFLLYHVISMGKHFHKKNYQIFTFSTTPNRERSFCKTVYMFGCTYVDLTRT